MATVVKVPGVGPKFILRIIIQLLTLLGIIYIIRSLIKIDNTISTLPTNELPPRQSEVDKVAK